MTLRNQLLIWAALLLFSVLLLWVFRSILLPFIVGGLLAYLLNPVVNVVQKLRIGRGWSTALVLLLVLALITGLFVLIVPVVVQQAVGLAQRLPGYITDLQLLANEWVPALNEWLGTERAGQLEASLAGLLNDTAGIIGNVTAGIFASGATVINTLGLIVVTPVVAFYLLLDWESMTSTIDDLLPREHIGEIRGLLEEMNRQMAAWIRGQGGVVLVLCIYYSVALSLTGLSFGLAIGLIAGLLSFIPFIGFLTGFVLSMTIATVQFWPNWVMVLIIFMVFMIGQFLEGNVLYPKLVGSSIGINPVWLMFALFAFAFLFGFVGLLLAVPLSAMTAVLLRFAIRKYQESKLYLGEGGDTGGDATAA